MRVAVIVAFVTLLTTPSEASTSCMSKTEAREHFGTVYLYWHGPGTVGTRHPYVGTIRSIKFGMRHRHVDTIRCIKFSKKLMSPSGMHRCLR